MPPLTNAERQARYRKRLHAKASGDDLGERASQAAEAAVQALWAYLSRPDDEGRMDATLDDIPTVDDFAQFLAADPGRLAEYCREVAQSADALIDAEAKAITTLIEIADAVELSAKRPAKTPKRRTR